MTKWHLIVGVLMCSIISGSHVNAAPNGAPGPASVSSPAGLKLEMRRLWSDRVFWARMYLIAALNEAPDAEVSATRLFKNDEELAHTLTTFYGETARRSLAQALHDQSSTLVSLARAAKASAGTLGTSASEPTNMSQLLDQWRRTGDRIEAVLGTGHDPGTPAGLDDALHGYLSATVEELEARVNKDWDRDVQAFDKARDSALGVADAMSDRIAARFADRFTGTAGTAGTAGIR